MKAIPGDPFISEQEIKHLSYLKIDTEGHDLEVIKGAEKCLTQKKIDFVEAEVSMNPTNTYHVDQASIISQMNTYGYYLFGVYEQILETQSKVS